MFRNRKFLMFISFLVAICLWVYVMGNVDPETTLKMSEVKVEMQGTDVLDNAGLKAKMIGPKVVSVTLEGKRSQVNETKKKGVEAYIDVSTCDYGMNETGINIRLPEGVTGVTVESVSAETAKFKVK